MEPLPAPAREGGDYISNELAKASAGELSLLMSNQTLDAEVLPTLKEDDIMS